METIPGETLAKIGLGEEPSSLGACSRRAPLIGNMKNLDNDFLNISFFDKSILSSLLRTFSPRSPKSRTVKTEQKHPGEHYLDQFGFVSSLQVPKNAWNQREVKNIE